jgi:hypothetical protein
MSFNEVIERLKILENQCPQVGEIISHIKNYCRGKKCRQFDGCFGTKNMHASMPNIPLIFKCQNAEVKHLLFEYRKAHEKFSASQQKRQDELWRQASEEIQHAGADDAYYDEEVRHFYPSSDFPMQNTWSSEVEEAFYQSGKGEEEATQNEIDHRSWLAEIKSFMEAEEEDRLFKSEESKKLVSQFLSQFQFENTFEASIDFDASTMTAVLIPSPFSQRNANNFRFSPELQDNLLKQINSRPIQLKDAHQPTVKSRIGTVKSANIDNEGNMVIDAEVDDPQVKGLIKKYRDDYGISLGGTSTKSLCEDCGFDTRGSKKCPKCGSDKILLKQFTLREISLTSDPAYSKAKILRYSEGDD